MQTNPNFPNSERAPTRNYGRQIQYSYDNGDRLGSETDTNSAGSSTTLPYGYDNADQLTSAASAVYSYDQSGNRTMTGYQTGTDNRLVTDGTWNYAYDNEGNIVQKVRISDGQTWLYSYDNANRLTKGEQYDVERDPARLAQCGARKRRARERRRGPGRPRRNIQRVRARQRDIFDERQHKQHLSSDKEDEGRRKPDDGDGEKNERCAAEDAGHLALTATCGALMPP